MLQIMVEGCGVVLGVFFVTYLSTVQLVPHYVTVKQLMGRAKLAWKTTTSLSLGIDERLAKM